MKKIVLFMFLIFFGIKGFSQSKIYQPDYEIKLTEFYKNIDTKLEVDSVIIVDSLSKQEIKNKIKNS